MNLARIVSVLSRTGTTGVDGFIITMKLILASRLVFGKVSISFIKKSREDAQTPWVRTMYKSIEVSHTTSLERLQVFFVYLLQRSILNSCMLFILLSSFAGIVN